MESILTYEQVYRDYDRKVMGYIRPRINNPSDAEELHSAVFMKVFEKFSSFDQTNDELAAALEKLPQRERDLIILHYYNNMQLKEIAVKMHMSYSNCKLIHNKALMKLRQYLS